MAMPDEDMDFVADLEAELDGGKAQPIEQEQQQDTESAEQEAERLYRREGRRFVPKDEDKAKAEGKDDAWMVEDGHVTEGMSNNSYIIKNGRIITRGLSNDILHGITRAAVLRYAREAQMEVEERLFTIEEAREADEAFTTSASAFVMPVVAIDDAVLGDGTPGPVARRLREIYLDESLKAAI